MGLVATERALAPHVQAVPQPRQRLLSGGPVGLISPDQRFQLGRHEAAERRPAARGEHPGIPGQVRIHL